MSATARLFINRKDAGSVTIKSMADSWGFGEFKPSAAFAEFAPIFGNWSLLIHADDGERRLSEAASEELRAAEMTMDALRTKMHLERENEWVDLSQVNIDGPLIEWKVSTRNAEPVEKDER